MKRRPPQLALTQCTDSSSGGLEHGDQFDPTPMLDRPGGHSAVQASSSRCEPTHPSMLDRPGGWHDRPRHTLQRSAGRVLFVIRATAAIHKIRIVALGANMKIILGCPSDLHHRAEVANATIKTISAAEIQTIV